MSGSTFPFSAIIGQPQLKLALMLCAVDPRIGGVLLSGSRGTAKSTIARALIDLLPGAGRFATLPLGASEERITGTLDLQKVLADGSVAFSPGLLLQAHGGVLYVDEVNLLADHLADLLLDVAASGVNTVERDGVSHRHPAEFVLVGTMNPEEGELRPQLLDRYGLCVQVADNYSVDERIAIVRTRLAYDTAPDVFLNDYAEAQNILVAQCQRAREMLAKVTVDTAIECAIAELCQRENVEGVRADIVLRRAAIAHAALAQRGQVVPDDVDAVAEFALAHRRNPAKPMPPHAANHPAPAQPENTEQPNKSGGDGDWGALPSEPVGTGARRQLDLAAAPTDPSDKKKRR